MDIFEALYTTRAMRRVRPDPVPMEVQAADPGRRHPGAVGRQHPELALPAPRRRRRDRPDRPPVPARHRRAVDHGVRGPAGRRRTPTPTMPRASSGSRSRRRPTGWVTTSPRSRSSSSPSSRAIRPVGPSTRRCGVRSSPPGPTGWGAPSPPSSASGIPTRPSRSWACRRTNSGSWRAASVSGTRPVGGASRPGDPCTRWPTATGGVRRSVSRSISPSGHRTAGEARRPSIVELPGRDPRRQIPRSAVHCYSQGRIPAAVAQW